MPNNASWSEFPSLTVGMKFQHNARWVRGTRCSNFSHPELETLFFEGGVGAEEPPGQCRGDCLTQEVEVSHKPSLALEEQWIYMQDIILSFVDHRSCVM